MRDDTLEGEPAIASRGTPSTPGTQERRQGLNVVFGDKSRTCLGWEASCIRG